MFTVIVATYIVTARRKQITGAIIWEKCSIPHTVPTNPRYQVSWFTHMDYMSEKKSIKYYKQDTRLI